MRSRFWIAICVGWLLSGCSSLSKQASELYEAGAYDESVRTYDQLLAQEPDNAEAIHGRALAREKLVDTKLIEIRQSRLAGNQQNALDMLHKVVAQENAWGFYPKGAVAYTQEEESREALNYVESQVRAALPSHHPLRAEYLLTHYGPIFAGNLQARAAGLMQLARGERRTRCRQLVGASAKPGPYFVAFLQKYCGDAAAVPKSAVKSLAGKYAELYRGVKAKVQVEGLPPGYAAAVREALHQGLVRTPWYDAKGAREWDVAVGGKYAAELREKPEIRWHQYEISVPYVAFEEQPRSREVPYQTTEYRCTPLADGGQNCTHVPVTRFRSETYNETVPVTRYRAEPRTQPYQGTMRSQTLALNLAAAVRFGGVARELGVVDQANNNGFEHDTLMPDIGLRPQKANLPDPDAWLREEIAKLTRATETQGNAAWEERYCRPLAENRSLAETGEQVHRCLRRKPAVPPRFVETWYERHLGITVAQADEVFGVKDF